MEFYFSFQNNTNAMKTIIANGAPVAAAATSGSSSAASGKSASSTCSASASKAAQSDSPDENAAGHLQVQGKAMAAALGGALVVATALVL